MPIVQPRPGIRALSTLLVLLTLVTAPAAAYAQSDADIEKVTKQNKKAVEEYENLNFEEARKILKDAIDFCAANGLDKHPIKARTHIHLGIVILAGFKQRDNAIKQFRKALEIQPDIKLTKSLANPEIQEAFDEAQAGMGSPEKPDTTKTEKPEKTQKVEKPDDGQGEMIVHEAVTEATQGSAITITAHVDINLNVKKLILAYRPDGAKEFLGRVMREVTQGNWTAEIPSSATAGNRVAYYIEAQAADEATMGKRGTEEDPLIIVLKGHGAPVEKDDEEGDEGDEDDEGGPGWYLGLGIGFGTGLVTGSAEENPNNSVSTGFAPASLGHLVPELGYFVKPNIMVSIQGRLQMVTGNNNLNLVPPDPTQCGGDNVCKKATSAIAVLARLTYFFGRERFHPYISISAGGGEIRHVVSFVKAPHTCGPKKNSTETCADTVLGGTVFVGPGFGFAFNVSPKFALTLGASTLLGFPKTTFNVDLNAGVAAEF
jgi:hypothetical protein